MLKLDLSKSAKDFLDTLPPKQFRQLVTKVFALIKQPEPHDSEPVIGFPYRRTDVGEYRIVYDVQGENLRVLLIGKRNDDEIYKSLRRMK
jgi:mRNA interferase RelE/StbE